jgi:acid phosphatase
VQCFTADVNWAKTHNSWFVPTFDEDNRTDGNHIAAILSGAGVRPGQYPEHFAHYDLLHSVQTMYRLPYLGQAAGRAGLPLTTASQLR